MLWFVRMRQQCERAASDSGPAERGVDVKLGGGCSRWVPSPTQPDSQSMQVI